MLCNLPIMIPETDIPPISNILTGVKLIGVQCVTYNKFLTRKGKVYRLWNIVRPCWGKMPHMHFTPAAVKVIRIFHGCEMRIEKSVPRDHCLASLGFRKNPSEGHCLASRGFAEWCQTMIPRDGFFYPHRTTMIDSFSCIPFDLQHLILM